MGDFIHVVDVGLELGDVVSEPEDFCDVQHCMFAFLHFFCQNTLERVVHTLQHHKPTPLLRLSDIPPRVSRYMNG